MWRVVFMGTPCFTDPQLSRGSLCHITEKQDEGSGGRASVLDLELRVDCQPVSLDSRGRSDYHRSLWRSTLHPLPAC